MYLFADSLTLTIEVLVDTMNSTLETENVFSSSLFKLYSFYWIVYFLEYFLFYFIGVF